jgi:hypothetical protein
VQAEAAGIVQLNEDEAGPCQAIPQPEGHPALQPHEYERGGTAKLLTLFRPATGEFRAKGVVSVTNTVLHPWLKGELGALLAELERSSRLRPCRPKSSARPRRSGKPGCGRMRVLRGCRPYASSWCWIIWPDTYHLTCSAGSSTRG